MVITYGAVVVTHTCMVVTHVHVRYLVFEQGGLVGRPIEARAQRRATLGRENADVGQRRHITHG